MNGKTLALGTFGILVALVLLVTFTTTEAVTSSSEVNISVQVATRTMVDIAPESITWLALEPGEEGNASDVSNQNVNRPGSIQIENVGSTNITKIWFNTTYTGTFGDPTTRPFGTGDNGSYDAGNFVVLSKYNQNDYYWVNRVDYNESQELVYLNTPTDWYYGRIRNGSEEYFFAIDTSGDCNTTTIRIGNTPHTLTQDGTTDFTDGNLGTGTNQYREWTLTDVDNYTGVADIYIGEAGNERGYCIAVRNCSSVMLYKWNMDAPGASQCGNATYFLNNETDSELTPGSSVIADLRVRVPYGVYQGYVKEGILTVIVQSEESS